MRSDADGMALQARRSLAREQRARHGCLLGSEGLEFRRYVRHGLRRQRLEEPDQFLNLDGREIESRHSDLEIPAHAVPVGILFAQGGVRQEPRQPFRADARAFRYQPRGQLTLAVGSLVLRQRHQHRVLVERELVAPHAIILLNDPPPFLDVVLLTFRKVKVSRRILRADAPHQERGQLGDLLARLGREVLRRPLPANVAVLRLKEVRHLELFAFSLHHAVVVDFRPSELVLEKSLVVPPALVFGLPDVQGEVELLERLRALDGELGADPPLVFHTPDFVAARAAVAPDDGLTLSSQLGIVQVRSGRVRGGVLLLQRHQVAANVARFLPGEAQVGHRRHLLDCELLAVVRALRVVDVEDVGQVVLLVVVRRQVALLNRTIRRRALARVVYPAHQVVVVHLLAHAAQVRSEPSPHRVRAFADRVTAHAAARLKALLALDRVSGRLRGGFDVEPSAR